MFKHKENDVENGVVVIGLGRFGIAMAAELELSGTDVLAIDLDPEVVQKASLQLARVVRADATDEEVLRQLAVNEYSRAVVAIGDNLAASILSVSALLKMGGPEVWAMAATTEQGQILEQMGIRHVFYPNADMGRRAAHLVLQSFLDYVELGYGFALVAIKAVPLLTSAPLGKLDLRRRDGITVIAVRGDDGSWHPANADTVLTSHDTVLVVAPISKLGKLQSSDEG